jgi:hypothetical protein
MVSMNPFREAFVFVQLNWRIIALCLVVAVVSAMIASRSRNDHRFEPVAPGRVLDTRTGQYCDPYNAGGRNMPKCADLAKSWR